MTWDTTYTATANSAMTAAQWNQNVRDNLLGTGPALAPDVVGYRFVTTDTNTIDLRSTLVSSVSISDSTESTTFTDLQSFGPSLSVVTGPSALAVWFAELQTNVANSAVDCSVATQDVEASLDWAIILDGGLANQPIRLSSAHLFTDLTPGTNTFTMKYAVGSNVGTFSNRKLLVFPF